MRDSIGTVLLSGRFATDEALSAARIGLINRSGQHLELEQLLPVIVGPGDLSLGQVPASEWVFPRQPRMKNDLPACVRLVPPSGEVAIDDVASHGCEVVKVQPYRPEEPHLLRTDGHFSMGGVEITDWQSDGQELRIARQWARGCPLELEVLLPGGEVGQAVRLHVAASARERQDSGLQVRGPR